MYHPMIVTQAVAVTPTIGPISTVSPKAHAGRSVNEKVYAVNVRCAESQCEDETPVQVQPSCLPSTQIVRATCPDHDSHRGRHSSLRQPFFCSKRCHSSCFPEGAFDLSLLCEKLVEYQLGLVAAFNPHFDLNVAFANCNRRRDRSPAFPDARD